jgi:hypothetical protein
MSVYRHVGRQFAVCSFHAMQQFTVEGERLVRCVTTRDPPGRRIASAGLPRCYKTDALGREAPIRATGSGFQA